MSRMGLWLTAAALVSLGLPASVLAYGRGGAARAGGARVSGPRGGYAAGGHRSAAAVGPYGGSAARTRSGGTVVGPAGGSAGYRSGSGTATTPRGGTVHYGGAATGRTGPAGGSAGRYVGGVQVTTPSGRTESRVGTGGAAVGPGGAAVGGRRSAGTAAGPRGAAAGVSRGGVAVGPYGAAAGASRGAVATGRGGTAAVRRGTYHVSGAALHMQGTFVRSGFRYYNAFTPTWYGRYPTAWRAARWTAATAWAPATWAVVSRYCRYPATPVYYDYGTTVVYEGDTVYSNGEEAGTADQYAREATLFADAGRAAKPSEEEQWQPLGVFALVRGEERTSDKIFQLAVNKGGVIRGNYYDAVADNTLPVYGSVHKKTQRAAWSIGEKKDVVFEAGIANLTRDETPILVHYGKDNTQQFTLVRVEQPKEDQGR
jgi:hypothetical protein